MIEDDFEFAELATQIVNELKDKEKDDLKDLFGFVPSSGENKLPLDKEINRYNGEEKQKNRNYSG